MNQSASYFIFLALVTCSSAAYSEPIVNSQIDEKGFLADVVTAHSTRQERRLTEAQFISAAAEKGTIILDARSAARFKQMHIRGAQSLPFTDFTADNLRGLIPDSATKILIYCNNNVVNSPVAFANKAPAASLNLSTLPALFTYGYKNVYELGPVIDPAKSLIKFDGDIVKPAK